MTVIQTRRMILRPLVEEDRAEFVRTHSLSDAHFRPWMPTQLTESTPNDWFDEALERARKGLDAGTECRLGGFLAEQRLVGIFTLSQIFRGPFQNAYAGWRISADCIKQGLGTEGVTGLLDIAFGPAPIGLSLHRVQANVIPTNVASLRLARSCGFREEGLAKEYLEIGGRYQDHAMLAKLVDEHSLSTRASSA